MKCNKRIFIDLRYKVFGLIEGYEYEFRIMVENVVGISVLSFISSFYKVCDIVYKFGLLGNLCVLDISRLFILIVWNKFIYDGGFEIIGYMVEIVLLEEDEWKIVILLVGFKVIFYIIINFIEN